MRVLKFLFTTLVFVAIVGGIGVLIGREVLLIIGVADIRSSVARLKSAYRDRSQFARECEGKGAPIDSDLISALQLRFISSTEYVVEVVCGQFVLDPIIIERKSLPFLVSKVPGSGGIIWGDEPSAMAVTVLGRSRTIAIEQRESFYENYKPGTPFGKTPVTSCTGFGFSCCEEGVSLGQGEQNPAALDCPRSCYSSCKERPVVLSLATDPYLQIETRSLEASTSETITFSYVVSVPVAPGTVTITYGDGQSDQLTELTGSFTHQYSCEQAQCEYIATVSVVDADGTTSADVAVSKATVFIKP